MSERLDLSSPGDVKHEEQKFWLIATAFDSVTLLCYNHADFESPAVSTYSPAEGSPLWPKLDLRLATK